MKTLYLPKRSAHYVLLQRTAYFWSTSIPLISRIPVYFRASFEGVVSKKRIARLFSEEMEREYHGLKAFLPASVTSVLDIGCGIAGIDAMIAKDYAAHFTLLDTSFITTKIWYGFKSNGCYYNSLDTTRDFLEGNGVPADHLHLFDVKDKDQAFAKKFDVIISLLSWGFHYPVEIYLDQAIAALTDHGVLIIDVRKGTGGYEKIVAAFNEVKTIYEDEKYMRVAASSPARKES